MTDTQLRAILTEALDHLAVVVGRSCTVLRADCQLHSHGDREYAHALRFLGQQGRVVLVEDHGNVVTANWTRREVTE